MARKSKTENDETTHWMNEIKAGEKYRDTYSKSKAYPDYRKYYRGDWKGNIVPTNRIFSFGRALIPQVYFRNPRVTCTATRPDLVAHSMVVEAIDNWLIKELKLKQVIKRAILHSYLSGTCPVKLGYDSEFGYNPLQAVDQDSSTVTQVGRKGEAKGKNIEYNVNIKPGMPWAQPCLPEDVIIPWGYYDPDSLPWISHRILRPLEDVQADQKYKNTSELKGSRRARYVEMRPPLRKDDSIKFCELFEIRDIRSQEVLVICEDKLLLKDKDALQIEGPNYEFLTFNEDPEFFWGIPDVSILEPQQLEYNEIRTQASRHRKIALLKFLYLKGAVTKDQLDAFLSGEVGPAVEVDGESLANSIITLTPSMPVDLRSEAMSVLGDMQLSMGFNENATGNFKPGTPPSAGEVQASGNIGEARIEERRDIVHDLLVNIIRKWNQYIFSFWTGDRVIKIVGPKGSDLWIQYTGEELKGEYSLIVDPDSGLPITKGLRQQVGEKLLKQYGGDPLIDQQALRRMDLQNYEWVSPGVSSLLVATDTNMATLLANQRQPSPAFQGGSGPAVRGQSRGGGQRGGGAAPGSSPNNPMPFDKFKGGR